MANANATAYPFAAPSVNGSTITVETMLNQPTRITRYLSDIALRNYISPLIFSTPGGVSGGAVIYDQLTLNDLFPTRDVQEVAPGAEFPNLTSEDGKIQREGRKIMNAMVRRQDARSIAILDAALAQFPSQTVVASNWNSVVTGGSSQTNAALWPASDIARVQGLADTQELGVVIDTLIVNPNQAVQLSIVYGDDLNDVLESAGIDNLRASNRVAPGTAFALAAQQPGEMRPEKALGTETWREPGSQRTWVQTDARFVSYVTDPYSVFKLTGLAG